MKHATQDQKDKAEARRLKFRALAKSLSALPKAERDALAARLPGIVTVEGRALSTFNMCLIAAQCPGATIVGGFKQWKKAGRSVRKGECGLSLWIPGGMRKREDGSEHMGFVSGVDGANFALWPKGDPAGKRSSDAAYSAHWSHCGAAFHSKRAVFKPGMPAAYPSWVTSQLNMPIPQAPAWVLRAINPGARIDSDDVPAAAQVAQTDNVRASQSPRVRAVRQIAPAVQAFDVRAMLEAAIQVRERKAA